jgi:hypothetical protein
MNIKRYDIFPVNHQAGNEIESPQGRYARFEDVVELQATIAQLTAENDEPEWHQMMTKLEDQNTELRAEIERLKGGQGEPVALYPCCTILKECNTSASGYSLQPVPVPAVLPEHAKFLRNLDSGNGQPNVLSRENHGTCAACGETPRVYGGYQTGTFKPMYHDYKKASESTSASTPKLDDV